MTIIRVVPIIKVTNIQTAVDFYSRLGFVYMRDPDGNMLRFGSPLQRSEDDA